MMFHPAEAYKDLTDAELLTLRHHRQAIKSLISCGWVPPVIATQDAPVAPKVVAAPAVPEDIRRVIHFNDPAEVERRIRETTAQALQGVGRMSPFV
jgi:hypothetical protein